ncbi:hypothetical protein ACLOJK_011087 [Asimina triloba]
MSVVGMGCCDHATPTPMLPTLLSLLPTWRGELGPAMQAAATGGGSSRTKQANDDGGRPMIANGRRVHHFTWAAGAPKSGAPPSSPRSIHGHPQPTIGRPPSPAPSPSQEDAPNHAAPIPDLKFETHLHHPTPRPARADRDDEQPMVDSTVSSRPHAPATVPNRAGPSSPISGQHHSSNPARTHQPNPSANDPPNQRYQTHPTADPKTHPIATTWTATINIKQLPVQQGDASKQTHSSICGRPIKADPATMVIRVRHSQQGANPSRTIQRGVTHSNPTHRPASPDPGIGHPSKQQQIWCIRSRWAPFETPNSNPL